MLLKVVDNLLRWWWQKDPAMTDAAANAYLDANFASLFVFPRRRLGR